MNGGTCGVVNDSVSLRYKCQCPAGWYGRQCNVDNVKCEPDTDPSQTYCWCPRYVHGDECSTQDGNVSLANHSLHVALYQ